jgi:8-oxo-dGTP pyrophosphatase MutT (NUDIX family)
MKNWKLIKKKRAFSCDWITVDEQELLRPNGSIGHYFIVNKSPVVVIIPVDSKGRLLLVNEFRAAVNKRVWSFPAGYAETKTFLSDAKRELKEETGIIAKKWKFLGKTYHNPGLLNDLAVIYLAQDLAIGTPERELSEEDMVTKWMSVSQVRKMIRQGEVFGGGFLTSLYFYLDSKKLL